VVGGADFKEIGKAANSYSPPLAVVLDLQPENESARPTLVWVILGYQAVGLIFRLVLRVIVNTGALHLSPAVQRTLLRTSLPELLITSCVLVAWMIQFWRLKRSAPFIYTLLLLYSLVFHILLNWSTQATLPPVALTGVVSRWCINIAVCAYAWTLWRQRVLK
jgi:hypothetical protein